jgi:chromosome segregation ATPase
VADLPNFDALRAYLAQSSPGQANLSELLTPVGSWIDKLEEWSKDRLRELEDARDERFDAEQKRMETEADLEDAADAYRSLVETLHDFERGIRDWQEVQDLLPDPLGTFTKGNPWQGS